MSDENETATEDDAAARRKKLIGRLVWGFLIASVGATIAWRIACGGSAGKSGEVQWRCVPEPPRDVVCVFESDVAAPGVCFDLVLTCEDGGEHRTEVCSGALEAGGRNEVAVGELTPPLAAKPVCGKPRYEHQRDL